MGWYYQNQTRRELIAELTAKSIAFQANGNTLWTVEETEDGRRIICCLLLASNSPQDWGYKPMDETVGPCYYDCPLGFLQKAKDFENVGYSAKWRDAVRNYHK